MKQKNKYITFITLFQVQKWISIIYIYIFLIKVGTFQITISHNIFNRNRDIFMAFDIKQKRGEWGLKVFFLTRFLKLPNEAFQFPFINFPFKRNFITKMERNDSAKAYPNISPQYCTFSFRR